MQTRVKKKNRNHMTQDQFLLVRNSLKQLLGRGLLVSKKRKSSQVEHEFLQKGALNLRFLNS